MRAVYPETSGLLDRDGVEIGFETYGEGPVTILLLPTWTIIHTRFWKMQIPYLARHFRVIASSSGHTSGNGVLPFQDNNHEEAHALLIYHAVLASQ